MKKKDFSDAEIEVLLS